MPDKAILEKFLTDQKTELNRQVDFVKRLRNEYYKLCGEMSKQDWKSMDSLLVLVDTWEKNLSLAERNIKELEKLIKKLDSRLSR